MTPTHIVLHHSLTKDSETVSWGAIRRYHTSWKCNGEIITQAKARELMAVGVKGVESPWRDIGYHFGIELIGNEYEVLLGRMPYETGAHCTQQGMNSKALGILFTGNFDLIKPPEAMWKKGLLVVAALCKAFKIPVDNIQGHRYYAGYKSCPGKLFDVDKFKKDLERR